MKEKKTDNLVSCGFLSDKDLARIINYLEDCGMSEDDIILILVDRGWAELKDDVKGKGKK